MWVLDPERREFLESNAAACQLYGYTQNEFRAMTLSDVESGEEMAILPEIVRAPISTTPSAWRHRTKSGRLIDVEIVAYEIDYGGHKAELAILLDITGRRRLEDQLRQAQKMEAVGMLAWWDRPTTSTTFSRSSRGTANSY